MTIEAGDIVFLDTSVLLAATDEGRADHRPARWLWERGGQRGVHPALSGQVVREYLVVATRPEEANGLGMDLENALQNVTAFLGRAAFYEETEAVGRKLAELVGAHGIQGKRIHDANVVATMLAHGLSKLVTANTSDFELFSEIHVIAPATAGAALPGGE